MDQMSQTSHQYLVFHTVNVLVITHNGEICKDKVIKHLNIFITIRCTIYDSMLMACNLLTYHVLRSKVFLPSSFHSFLVFQSKLSHFVLNQRIFPSDILGSMSYFSAMLFVGRSEMVYYIIHK